ncbi:putative esterase [Variovorax paradoxus B4]|uniref:Putative esterase n=1 Tax=Variovorax paradoxus B4 TaxID=1246301 RepID=T1XLK2_VARPD|nr:alpha/beta hydrolase [Variovorax paradoxus]AGU53757.1 putative esterase [Variovorax paradoxus B4]
MIGDAQSGAALGHQGEIDAQYDAGASVPDYPAYLTRWQEESATARLQLPCRLRLPYGATAAEKLDIFCADAPAAPVHVFFHGGYWRSLGASDFSFVAYALRNIGFTTVVVDYALCPSVSITEIVRQARASIAWVYGNIERFGGDPARITVGGHSAGGHLAMMSLLAPWKEAYALPEDVLNAAVSVSGLHDLAPLQYSYLQPALRLDEETIDRCSPMRHVKRVPAPVLVTWGALESQEFLRQGSEFAAQLANAGCRVDCSPLADAHHFSVLDAYRDADSRICQWLRRAVD